ncbi:hypothetical protein CEXT_306981 [Caerostris extrusa]|uniref:Uncharacterized protein n=1 Tax=Caerostris extrusa TaxID=172846 RepID=A0AAV4XUQ7_CAEEX|nr:hypothetical protein CEXT_306981 [Caerostris extrusa]
MNFWGLTGDHPTDKYPPPLLKNDLFSGGEGMESSTIGVFKRPPFVDLRDFADSPDPIRIRYRGPLARCNRGNALLVGGPTRNQQGPSFLVVSLWGSFRMVTWENEKGEGGQGMHLHPVIDRFRRGKSYLMEYTRSSGFAVVLCTAGGHPAEHCLHS